MTRHHDGYEKTKLLESLGQIENEIVKISKEHNENVYLRVLQNLTGEIYFYEKGIILNITLEHL